MAALLRSVPDVWGPKFDADGGAVTQTRTGPDEIAFTAPAHMALVMLSPQPDREVALGSDRKVIATAPVGAIELVPAEADLFARWTVKKENILLAIAPARLAHLAGLEFQNESVELQPARAGRVDRKALLLSNLIREEFQRGPAASEACFDGLITLFALHLLRSYSSCAGPAPPLRGGLSPRTWHRIVDYIDANLSQRLTVTELAQLAGLSPSHFLRAFRETCGQAPHQFIVAARLASAEHLIRTTRTPVAAVAKAAGFSSNSHLTAILKRVRGVTPSEIRKGTR